MHPGWLLHTSVKNPIIKVDTRRIEMGKEPVLALSFHKSPPE
jgi:hypothetical protein